MPRSEYNLFISWSGEPSRHVAEALRGWIPTVVQAAKPFMSEEDIEKGARGINEISRVLNGIKVGISCLTPGNLTAPWILYEAGALTKTIDDKTRLCTYLLAELRPQDVEPPLAMFQHTRPEKEDTRKLVETINQTVHETPISKASLDQTFDALWPKLEDALHNLPQEKGLGEPRRTSEEMIVEILEITRAEANRRGQSDWIDAYIPMLKDLFPFLEQAIRAARQGAGVAPQPSQAPAGPSSPPAGAER